MINDKQIFSIEFSRDGYLYSMHVIADKLEAEFIADSLGLSQPEQVVAIIPNLQGDLN